MCWREACVYVCVRVCVARGAPLSDPRATEAVSGERTGGVTSQGEGSMWCVNLSHIGPGADRFTLHSTLCRPLYRYVSETVGAQRLYRKPRTPHSVAYIRRTSGFVSVKCLPAWLATNKGALTPAVAACELTRVAKAQQLRDRSRTYFVTERTKH